MTTLTYVITAGGKATIKKDANARKLYGIDLTDVLAEIDGRFIQSAEIVAQAGVSAEAAVIQGPYVVAWVTGGTTGDNYVTFRYTLSDTSIDDITLHFDIQAR